MTAKPLSTKKLKKYLSDINSTQPGKEPSMYPAIKDIFVHLCGHDSKSVFTDSRNNAGLRPDVAVTAKTRDGVIVENWIVVEAKDERNVFLDDNKANRIFETKWRYVTTDTEWFIGIDPEIIRVRPITYVDTPDQGKPDLVITISNMNMDSDLLESLTAMHRDALTLRSRLRDFREGKEGTFGRIDIGAGDNRRLFIGALSSASKNLSQGVKDALNSVANDRLIVRESLERFSSKFPEAEIKINPFKARGASTVHREDAEEFRFLLAELRENYRTKPVAFMIELTIWKSYLERSENERKANELLIEETSALLLSRILMLRFFEDYGYFGSKRFLCNGGVAAFQAMRNYFELNYPALIRQAYEAGGRIYQIVFDSVTLDWVLDSNNVYFSSNLEQAMLSLSVFDFRTIKEELLSAIYGAFFDDKQRKAQGEHYTPPSIARWIIRRTVDSNTPVKLLDPACGFGTFLVEGYQETIGQRLRRGLIDQANAEAQTRLLRGNDLNLFSATVAQMQMIWNLIQAPGAGNMHPLPILNISGGFDALTPPSLYSQTDEIDVTPWSDADQDTYPTVVGNPPYVRPERREQGPTADQERYFAEIGARSNLYSLFVYKALHQWLKPNGKLGMVIPLTFVDTEATSLLRRCFLPNSKWTILEIVDLEEIKRAIFPAANVRPMILIAQKRTASSDDKVILRTASLNCVESKVDKENPTFDLDRASTSVVPYREIWSKDNRLLTRITSERIDIAKKIGPFPTFADVALHCWDLYKGSKIVDRKLERGDNIAKHRWKEKQLITSGIAARGMGEKSPTGVVLYKGENILPCQVVGQPVSDGINPESFDDPSVWRFPQILPEVAVAFSQIALAPTAVCFNPHTTAFLNTATLFIPQKELRGFPFDFLVLSSLYRWYFAVMLREGVVADFFSHIYPNTVRNFPWSSKLNEYNDVLTQLRSNFLQACRELAEGEKVLIEKLGEMETESLFSRVDRNPSLRLRWGGTQSEAGDEENFFRVIFGKEPNEYVEVNDSATADQLSQLLELFVGDVLTRDDVRQMLLPKQGAEYQYFRLIADYRQGNRRSKVDSILSQLDELVAQAFELSSDELKFIIKDLSQDSLFSRLIPRLPFQEKTVRGLLNNLTQGDRYTRV